eukprot:3945870-Prymnesium_polylepis.2
MSVERHDTLRAACATEPAAVDGKVVVAAGSTRFDVEGLGLRRGGRKITYHARLAVAVVAHCCAPRVSA